LFPASLQLQKNGRIFAALKASVIVWMALNYLAYNESIIIISNPGQPIGLFTCGEGLLNNESEVQESDTTMSGNDSKV
jgi:hypothetical protein